jgi:phosphoribosylformimino-5-aminoimidazole carboxamide ribotide isomerase
MPRDFEIIPAIDLIDGKCVRLSQGDFAEKTIYSESPVDVAKRFEDAGLTRVHMVDLDGARAGHICNLSVLESVATSTALVVDFSGGIKTESDVESVLSAGAAMVAVGSMAAKEPARIAGWIDRFGSETIIVGADVREGFVAVNGWETKTELELIPFLREMTSRGVRKVFVTDVSKDGLLSGPALPLYVELLAEFDGLDLIASGGVSKMEDLRLLKDAGCSGAIVGKALYEGHIDLNDLVAEFGG